MSKITREGIWYYEGWGLVGNWPAFRENVLCYYQKLDLFLGFSNWCRSTSFVEDALAFPQVFRNGLAFCCSISGTLPTCFVSSSLAINSNVTAAIDCRLLTFTREENGSMRDTVLSFGIWPDPVFGSASIEDPQLSSSSSSGVWIFSMTNDRSLLAAEICVEWPKGFTFDRWLNGTLSRFCKWFTWNEAEKLPFQKQGS